MIFGRLNYRILIIWYIFRYFFTSEITSLIFCLPFWKGFYSKRKQVASHSKGKCIFSPYITKTCLYKFDSLKSHFYIVKLALQGYTLYFLFLLKNIHCHTLCVLVIFVQNIDCGYSLEPPRWGGSNEYPQFMFWAEIWKYQNFYLKTYSFW